MSETGFLYFNMAFSVTAELLYAVCLTLFLRSFLTDRRRCFLVFGVYLLLRLLCDGAAIPQGSFGVLLIVLPTAASKVLGLEKAAAFLLAILYWNARTSSGLMVQSLFYFLEQWSPVPTEPLEAIYLRSTVLLTIFLVSHTALLAVMLYALQRQIRKQKMPLHWRELFYISLGLV